MQSAKNFNGSMPKETVLPSKGNQWKTTGGSFFVKKNNWRKTWKVTAATSPVAAYATKESSMAILMVLSWDFERL